MYSRHLCSLFPRLNPTELRIFGRFPAKETQYRTYIMCQPIQSGSPTQATIPSSLLPHIHRHIYLLNYPSVNFSINLSVDPFTQQFDSPFVRPHVNTVSCHHNPARPWVVDGWVAVNILNKQSRTTDKEWSSRLGLSEGLRTPHR